LFKRTHVELEVNSEIAPSLEDTLEVLSKKFSVKPEVIKIKGIKGKFGVKVFTIKANLYESKEEKDLLEIKKKRETELEKKQAEANKSVEVKEEPKEEKVEEKTE